jgi:hypothetical protein
MNRPIWLAAIVIVLAPVPGFAQPGAGGGMAGMMGGMGGGMMMGGRMMPASPVEVQRTAQVEMEGGQRLSGQIDLAPLTLQSDLGRYAIMPDKIKVIRFLKPANQDEAGNAADDAAPNPPQARAAMVMRARNRLIAGNAVADPLNPSLAVTMTRGKVVTTSGQEIIGNIYIPMDFKLELDYGTLFLAAPKLRSITFTDADQKTRSAKAGEAPSRAAGEAPDTSSTPPRYFRHEHSVIVASPAGDRVTLYDLETRKSQTLEISGSKDAPLEVTPILGKGVLALALTGPKITRIAIADLTSGTWHSQDLREPVEGRAIPVIAPGVAVYRLGRYAYAYSVEAQRWDVAELPERLRAQPIVGPNGATIEGLGHIYSFIPKAGKWEHIDVRGILDVMGAEPKK